MTKIKLAAALLVLATSVQAGESRPLKVEDIERVIKEMDEDAALAKQNARRDSELMTTSMGLLLCGSKVKADAQDCALYLRGLLHGFVLSNAFSKPPRFCPPDPGIPASVVLKAMLDQAIEDSEFARTTFPFTVFQTLSTLYPCR